MAPKRRALSLSPRRGNRRLRQQLCSQCAEIDFHAMFSTPASGGSRYEETFTVNSRASSSRKACAFCDFLVSMGPSDPPAGGLVQLEISNTASDYFPLLKGSSSAVLRVRCRSSFDGDRYFVSQSDPESPVRRAEETRLNYDSIQKWLKICQALHPNRCRPTYVDVPGMRLIDCEMKTIILASDQKYVTLSYLWGADEAETPFPDQLLEPLPRTIEDAMTVTQCLGFRYLWIDRYCIDQRNKSETSTQLQAMGSIYRNSHLTIIAAAGDDPSFGLPGVSKQPRHSMPEAKIGRMYLREILHISHLVNLSRWDSRGWTYQEGILATRRLVFTEQQVFFECHGMCCYETLDLDYAAMHSPECEQLESEYFTIPPGRPGERIGMFPAGYGGDAGDIYIQIARYTGRNLSHDSDRLKAFLGILEAFESGKHGVRHHWGIPILPFPDSGSPKKFSMLSFVFGLLWGHKFRDGNIRIKHLPSWSWAGMLGSVEFDYQMGDGSFWSITELLDEVQVEMELQSGDRISWEAFHSSYKALNNGSIGQGLSPYIHLSGWNAPARTTPLRNTIDGNNGDERSLANYRILSIEMDDGSSISHEVFMPDIAQCEVLVLGKARGEVFMLVVRKMEYTHDQGKDEDGGDCGNRNGDVYERVQRVFAASYGDPEVAKWSVKNKEGKERRFEYRDEATHDLPRKIWGEEWWRLMKGGGMKTFRLG